MSILVHINLCGCTCRANAIGIIKMWGFLIDFEVHKITLEYSKPPVQIENGSTYLDSVQYISIAPTKKNVALI